MPKKKDKHAAWLKKLGLREFLIHLGVFDYEIEFVVGKYESMDEYIRFKFGDKDFKNEDFGDALGRYYCYKNFCPIIWIPRKPRTGREYATLAHESLHAVFEVSRWANFPMNYDTEEVATHTLGCIMTKILKEL